MKKLLQRVFLRPRREPARFFPLPTWKEIQQAEDQASGRKRTSEPIKIPVERIVINGKVKA